MHLFCIYTCRSILDRVNLVQMEWDLKSGKCFILISNYIHVCMCCLLAHLYNANSYWKEIHTGRIQTFPVALNVSETLPYILYVIVRFLILG